ncbi:MAG: hypothetical protein WCC53_16685 [Thermoanaerobaculia bacterium]|jgi:predicted membrane channel-forming protein YqfA (hemolysin III family)
MSVLRDHFLLLVWLAALLSAFLALLWKDEPRARRMFFAGTFLALVGCSALAAWLLAAVPR